MTAVLIKGEIWTRRETPTQGERHMNVKVATGVMHRPQGTPMITSKHPQAGGEAPSPPEGRSNYTNTLISGL